VNGQAMRITLVPEKALPNRKRSPDPRTIRSSISLGYSLASSTGAWRDITPPEICDATRNATATAGKLINLKN
jgi:hypothetical protein